MDGGNCVRRHEGSNDEAVPGYGVVISCTLYTRRNQGQQQYTNKKPYLTGQCVEKDQLYSAHASRGTHDVEPLALVAIHWIERAQHRRGLANDSAVDDDGHEGIRPADRDRRVDDCDRNNGQEHLAFGIRDAMEATERRYEAD